MTALCGVWHSAPCRLQAWWIYINSEGKSNKITGWQENISVFIAALKPFARSLCSTSSNSHEDTVHILMFRITGDSFQEFVLSWRTNRNSSSLLLLLYLSFAEMEWKERGEGQDLEGGGKRCNVSWHERRQQVRHLKWIFWKAEEYLRC